MRRRLGSKDILAVWLALVLMLGAVRLGVRIPGLGFLDPLARTSVLDYSSPSIPEVAPLRSEFVTAVLGRSAFPEPSSESPRLPRPGGAPSKDVSVPSYPLTNDDARHAREVGGLPYAAKTDTAGSTRDPSEPASCAPVGNTVWYRYRAPASRGLVASTDGSRFATMLGVFSGSPGALHLVGCDSDPQGSAEVRFPAIRGVTYYFQIAGTLQDGELLFTLEHAPSTVLASVDSRGRQGKGGSGGRSISADGRFVSFASADANLDPAHRCNNCPSQVYVRDLVLGRVEMVSLSTSGAPANADSGDGGISADGRFVAFYSKATNLVPGDTNSAFDVFVRDRVASTTQRVSVNSKGQQADGPPGVIPSSGYPGISADGRFVVFDSQAWNLVPGDTNNAFDAFVHDRLTHTTKRISVSSDNAQGDDDSGAPSISPDGRTVVFISIASTLAPGVTRLHPLNRSYNPWLVYVRDLVANETTLESVSSSGQTADDYCFGASISAGGRFVSFHSTATNLAPGFPLVPDATTKLSYVYVRDRLNGTTERISVSSSGQPSPDHVHRPLPDLENWTPPRQSAISWDGRFVAFSSEAAGLVPDDTNGVEDVFVRDRLLSRTIRASVSSSGAESNDAVNPFIGLSRDGAILVFNSMATDLVPGDGNGTWDVFLRLL